MKPLLWKEMRELRPFLAVAGAAWLVLALLCLDRRFAEGFLSPYLALMPVLAMVAAIGLGASQMARERASRTLDFLVARPIAPGTIVWIKFLAGSVSLALLLAGMAALCYVDPGSPPRDYEVIVRNAVGFPQLAAVLFPRLWCAYALTLLLSALVDRTAKAVVAGFFCLLALWGGLIGKYENLLPFSNVGAWQLWGDSFGLCFRLLRDPALFRLTGFTLCALAPLLALAAARLFQRSPGWTLSNRRLILGAVALAGLAVLSTFAAANRLPVLSPVGSMELDLPSNGVTMNAGGGMVAVVAGEDGIQFLDFTDPARPRKAAEARIPLWRTSEVAVSGSRAYILGTKKALPVDEIQIAIAGLTPAGSVQFAEPIPLGAMDRAWFNGSMAVAGHFAYVGLIRQRQCRIEVYDLSPGASGRQVAAMVVDEVRVRPSDVHEHVLIEAVMRMRLQGQFLYVTSPSALTAIDIRDPSRPVAASRTEYRELIPMSRGLPRGLVSDGRWLLEAQPLLGGWDLYDLADPARPALRGHAPRQSGRSMVDSGPLLFETWRQGALEFRAANGGLDAVRYLTDGRDAYAWTIAAADGAVYMLKQVKDRWFISAYRVGV